MIPLNTAHEPISLPPIGEEILWDSRGWGFFEADPGLVYGRSYWDKYVGYNLKPQGLAIIQARVELVVKHCYPVHRALDYGAGTSAFCEALERATGAVALGYDVNPASVYDLCTRRHWWDGDTTKLSAICFWDSLEHLRNPAPLLWALPEGCMVFVAIPICRDAAHARSYKHFRADEHYWHFTEAGLERFGELHALELIHKDMELENSLGREDIGSFVFRKTKG